MDLSQKLTEAAQEIFSSMVMLEITVREGEEVPQPVALKESISGVIGLAGTHKGVLAIHLPNQVAIGITESFLGMEVESVNEDVEDAVGELANMLGGNVKSILSEKGRDIDLSLPSTVKGYSYEFEPTSSVERVIVPFICDAGSFEIEVQLEK